MLRMELYFLISWDIPTSLAKIKDVNWKASYTKNAATESQISFVKSNTIGKPINVDESIYHKYLKSRYSRYTGRRHLLALLSQALGPDVHSTLLKNLHNAARAKDAMAPLPKSKNPADATSRRKHQITYLANLAVAREEALQQQWAENKQMRMGRQKYGF